MRPRLAAALCLTVVTVAVAGADEAPWWHRYTTVATDPEFKTLEQVRAVNAETWRAAGWFAGWYGFWFGDMLEHQTDVPQRWARVIEAGARPMMYYDAGEVGDFVTLIDERNRKLLLDGWHWQRWAGEKGSVQWFGLEAFMNDVPWAPYPTARDHGLPAFTYPDGRPVPPGELYAVLARRNLQDDWEFMDFTNPEITDEVARRSGLAEVSHTQERPPEVQQGSGWVIGRLVNQDHMNPQLLAFQSREIDYAIRRFRPWGVHIDNFGATNLYPSHQNSFGLWAVHTFREFLRKRIAPERLAALGVKSVDTFDIREYSNTAYATPGRPERQRLRDPRWEHDLLFRAHLVHKIERAVRYWTEIYRSGKDAMKAVGLDNPVFGNTMPLLPGGGFMQGICDIAHFEWKTKGAYPAMPELGFPSRARVAYVSRLAERLSEAPYSWLSLYVTKAYMGEGHENLHKVLAFDCLANRGILDYNHWYLDAYSPGSDRSAGYVNTFIRAIAPEVSGREYLADIGLVYCPWSNVASMDAMSLRPELYLDEYKGWCDYLGNIHAQWDIVLSQDLSLETLRRFEVVVLPSMLVLTEPQVAMLDAYLGAGGRVIATGETGAFFGPEGFLVRRPASALDRLEGRSGLARSRGFPGRDYFASGCAMPGGLRRLLDACGLRPSLRTHAPETVGVNASLLARGGRALLTIDLNNHDLDVETDAVTPAKPCRVSVDLPDGLRGRKLTIVSADPERQGGEVWASFPGDAWRVSPDGRTLHLEVPSFRYFLCIAVKPAGGRQ